MRYRNDRADAAFQMAQAAAAWALMPRRGAVARCAPTVDGAAKNNPRSAVDLQRVVNAQFLKYAEAAAARGAEIWLRPDEEDEDATREYERAVALMKACITRRCLPYAHGPSKKYLCGSCGSLVVDCTCFEKCWCTGTILRWSWQRGEGHILEYGPYCECRNRQPQRDWFKFDS